MIVTRSDIKSFTRFAPKLALAGAAILILSAFAQSSDAAVFTAREGDAPLEFTLPAHETTMVAIPADPIASAVYDRHLIRARSGCGRRHKEARTASRAHRRHLALPPCRGG